jgi:hypothetical protein
MGVIMINFQDINSKIDILELLGLQGTKAASTTNGGEWKTACPVCGGRDRFSVWANHPSGACGWCRQCNRSFDALDLYQTIRNLDRKSAIQELQSKPVVIDDHTQSSRSNEKINLDGWNSKAVELCNQWHKDLYNNEAVFQWLIDRGISDHSIITNNIGFNDHDQYMSGSEWGMTNKDKVFIPRGITIPNPGHYVNIRRSVPSNVKDKYWKIAGSRGYIFIAGQSYDHTIGYLFESELDAILASQSGFDAAYFSLPAQQTIKPEFSHYLERIDSLIICMDNDKPGQAAAEKHLEIVGTVASEPLPGGCKDLTDYYKSTDFDHVVNWLLDQSEKIEVKQWM